MRKLLFYLILLLSAAVKAQNIIPKDIPTPNATSIAKYGDIPVSYYTGRANVSIPLYSTSVKGIPLNISLDYDTSGILVNSLPDWSGQNWTLNAGGVITRSIMEVPDEYNYDEFCTYKMDFFSNCKNLKNTTTSSDIAICKDTVDLAPDIFTFNFMGKTGRFFYGNDGEWKVKSEENFEVVFNVDDSTNYQRPFYDRMTEPYPSDGVKRIQNHQPYVIKGFVIRDDNGYRYTFGYDENAIEYTVPIYSIYNNPENESVVESDVTQNISGWQQPPSPWKATAWYLTEVKDKYGNLLYKLHYERGYYTAQFFVSSTASLRMFNGETNYTKSAYSDDGVLNSPVYLSDISCSNGIDISFSRVPSEWCIHKLYPSLFTEYKFNDKAHNDFNAPVNKGDRMFGPFMFFYLQTNSISDNQGSSDPSRFQYGEDGVECCNFAHDNSTLFPDYEKWKFKYYDPLKSTRLCDLSGICIKDGRDSLSWVFRYKYNKRKYLESLTLTSKTSSCEKYTFTYIQPSGLPDDYLTTAVDHWGYYNGPYNRYSLYSGPTDIQTCRDTQKDIQQYGMLQKITYPTGGYTALEYENNTYESYVDASNSMKQCSSEKRAGGLRVTAISSHDCNGKLLESRRYTYNGGELGHVPIYHWSWKSNCLKSDNSLEQDLTSSSSIFPLSNSFGPFLGYSEVTETVSNGTRNVYKFSNYSNHKDEEPIVRLNPGYLTPFDRYSEHDYERGMLWSVKTFSSSGNLVRLTEYDYDVVGPLSSQYVITSNYKYGIYNKLADYCDGCVYKIYHPKYRRTKTVEKIIEYDADTLCNVTEESNMLYTICMKQPYIHTVDISLPMSTRTLRSSMSEATCYGYAGIGNDSKSSNHILRYFDLSPDTISTYLNGQYVKSVIIGYSVGSEYKDQIYPTYIQEEYPGNKAKTIACFTRYSQTGALLSYTYQGIEYSLTWDKWENSILAKTKGGILDYEYDYTPLCGLTKRNLPNGDTYFYIYDSFGRLKEIRNSKNEKIQSFEYNYLKK